MMGPESHVFFGTSPQFVLIVAGIHANEQSGVEVVHWIRVKLAALKTPTRLGAIVIPEVYPDRGTGARTDEWRTGHAVQSWREVVVKGKTIYPARQFPPPGQALSFLKGGFLKDSQGGDLTIDRDKVPLLPEAENLLRWVEAIKPVRVVSAHGKRPRTKDDLTAAAKANIITMTADEIDKWDGVTAIKGVNFPGIFVDPRYNPDKSCQSGFELEGCKFNRDMDPACPNQGTTKQFDSANTAAGRKDDALALAAAKVVSDATLVAGNHVSDQVPIVHYAKEGGTPNAFSFGDWGPVDVNPNGNAPGSRVGAPVFTIEVKNNEQSWAFLDGVQIMTEDGKPLISQPTPAQRAVGKKGTPLIEPAKFDQKRSKELQAYAQAIIDSILALP